MLFKGIVFTLFLVSLSSVSARVPPRNTETSATSDEASAIVNNRAKEDVSPAESPVQRTPIDTSAIANDETKPTLRRPLGVILFRQPSLSLLSNRQAQPFSFNSPLLSHNHFNHFHSNLQDDPAIRLISALFGDRLRPISSGSPAEDDASSSESPMTSSSDDHHISRDVHPFESLFPKIFLMPRFPMEDEGEKEVEANSSNEDKTPANFENKEKKVIDIGGRKFVKTTSVKKVRNDFGQFHSVISSYQPFDEKLHDENGNDKVKPVDNDDAKTISSVDKKDVTSTETTPVASEKVDITTSSSNGSSTTTTSSKSEDKEEVTSAKPEVKNITPESERIRLPSESLTKEQDVSKNEISYKVNEIKVDQMN